MARQPSNLSALVLERSVQELWWMGAIQGTLAIFFGITAIAWPGLTLLTLVYLFSAFILAMGIIEIVSGLISLGRRSTWWLTLLLGLITLGIGVYLIRHPNVSFNTFILLVGLGLIARGLMDGMRAFVDRTTTTGRVLLALAALAAIVAGIIILFQPVSGGVAFVWVLGLYALIFGSLTLAVSFELRNELMRLVKSLDNDMAMPGAEARGGRRTRAA
jgi:uncharacterized membrane protein HdeD (DUF308 family)